MKKVLSLIVVLGLTASLIWIGVERYGFHKKTSSKALFTSQGSNPNAPALNRLPPLALMASDEWQKYRAARESALHADPALQAEYKDILQKIDTQQTGLDAAMLKADPKLTSVVAKLVALHNQHSGRFAAPKPSATGKVVLAPDAVTITAT